MVWLKMKDGAGWYNVEDRFFSLNFDHGDRTEANRGHSYVSIREAAKGSEARINDTVRLIDIFKEKSKWN